jgi:glucose/arabinose dehydrogenase
VQLTEYATGFERPVDIVARPGTDLLYVAEQHAGRIWALRDGERVGDAVLDIGGEVSTGNEQGLLGIEFSADGTQLYIDYTDVDGNTHVQEFGMLADGRADSATRREVLVVEQPYSNHNGGDLVRGPDGLLYIGLGDGGAAGDPAGVAQNLGSHLGKLLRIDPRATSEAPYSVPADNPFVDDADARPEIWQYGLRNPWRFSFDRATDDLWIGDVGQNAWEEIDYLPAGQSGANFGWDRYEGTHRYEGRLQQGHATPIYEGSHGDGFVSITGGYVYRGEAIPALRGAYVFGDLGFDDLFAIAQRDGRLDGERTLGVSINNVVGFGEDEAGELYVVSLDGTIYRIDPV